MLAATNQTSYAHHMIQKIAPFGVSRQIQKNDLIYQAGEQAQGFYYVKSGLVGLYNTTENGKESLLRLYGAGYFFGYRSLFTMQDYHATARGLRASEVVCFQISDLAQLAAIDSGLVNLLMQGVCYELGEAEQRLTRQASHSAGARIIDAITHLFSAFPEQHWTYREIGEFSGADTATVIRFCRQLKNQGFLCAQSRSIKPLSLHKLATYREQLITSA